MRSGLSLFLGGALALSACVGAIDGSIDHPRPTTAPAGERVADPGGGVPPRPGDAPPAAPPAMPPAGGSPSTCELAPRGAAPLRRLTRAEYDSTVADLLGDRSGPAAAFAPEAGSTGFDTALDGATTNDAVVEQYATAARTLAAKAAANLPALLGCNVATQGEDPCARQFIARFGRRAFRRGLLPDEQARYEAFYAAGKARSGFARSVELVLRAFLMAPQFLYRVELGAGAADPTGRVALTPHERAVRLSYLFWGTTPGDELLARADAGALSTADEVRAEAQRLLAHANGARVLRHFTAQWLGLDGLGSLARGPTYSPALAAAMRDEVETYFARLVRERNAGWSQLMTAPVSFVNGELAAIYGMSGVTGAELREVTRPPDRHRGFLTQPAFLALHAFPGDSSPIHRGVFLRERILCEPALAPPPDLDAEIPAADAARTRRQQIEAKTQIVDPCRVCHQRINPPGFAFDRFDQLGRWRTTDAQKRPLDPTGELSGTDVDGAFTGHTDLIERLGRSERVRACVVTQVYRYAIGRREIAGDCRQQALQAAFTASGGSIADLLLRLVTSDEFLYR